MSIKQSIKEAMKHKPSKKKLKQKEELAKFKVIAIDCPFCEKSLEDCRKIGDHPENEKLWLLALESHTCIKGGRSFKHMKDPIIVEKSTGLVLGTRLKVRDGVFCDIRIESENKEPKFVDHVG